MLEQKRFGDLGGLGQLAGGGAMKALVGKQPPDRFDYRGTPLLRRQLGSGFHGSLPFPSGFVSVYSLTRRVKPVLRHVPDWPLLDPGWRQAAGYNRTGIVVAGATGGPDAPDGIFSQEPSMRFSTAVDRRWQGRSN